MDDVNFFHARLIISISIYMYIKKQISLPAFGLVLISMVECHGMIFKF